MPDNKESIKKIEQLVIHSQKGDQDSFGELYDILIQEIYRYVYFKVRPEDASDLCAEVFVKAWEHIKSYSPQPGTSFRSWIFRIAHNIVIDYYRKNDQYEDIEQAEAIQDTSYEANVEESINHILTLEYVEKGMTQLKEEYRQIILLKFIQDFSNEEISEIMGKSEGAIRIIQYRALQELKKIIKEMQE